MSSVIKYSQLSETTSIADSDILSISKNTGGSYTSNKITWENVKSNIELISSGILVKPTIVANPNGTMIIGQGTYVTYSNSSFTSPLKKYVMPSAIYSFTDNVTNYVVFDSTSTPVITVSTNRDNINQSSIIPIITVFREGNELHWIDWDNMAQGLSNKISDRLVRTERFSVEDGCLVIGELPTRYVKISEGTVWYGAANSYLDDFTSQTDDMDLWYHVGGVWTKGLITQYNNLQYDNGTNLATLSATSRYAVNWVFRGVENNKHAFIVLGTADYKLSEAQNSKIPTNLPPIITSQTVLVGRIIVKKSEDTATEISSAFVVPFTRTPITDHSELSGLQGGTLGEYYHLTEANYNNIVTTEHLNIDQTTPQTTVGAFDFPIVKVNTTVDDGYFTPLQVKGTSTNYPCPDPTGLYSSPVYADYYDLYGISDGGSQVTFADGTFIDDTFDIQIWSVATASDLATIITPYPAVFQLTDSSTTPFRIDLHWVDSGGTLPTESYVVEIFQYSTGLQYWKSFFTTDETILSVTEFATWNSGVFSGNYTPYIVDSGMLSQTWPYLYAYKTTNSVTVYSAIPAFTVDADPNGANFRTTLYWDDVGADGYIIEDVFNYYYIDVGNVTSYEVDGLFDGWSSGTATTTPNPYTSYADIARFDNSLSYGVVIGGQGNVNITSESGYAPIIVNSSGLCDLLNVDLLDGQHSSEFQPAGTYVTSITANSPIVKTGTATVPILSHAVTAGNIHLPTGGSSNQLLKNSGTSGTGTWGTVTESTGALSNVTTIDMSGKFISTLQPKTGDTSTPPIKLTSGALTTIPQTGAVEFLEDKYYGTITTNVATFVSQYPPVQDGTYVKASTTLILPDYAPYFATDPTKSLIGTPQTNAWTGGFSEYTNQRFHIDLGSAKIITKIYYENYHFNGASTTRGCKNFTFWGSNTLSSFNTLTYATNTGWTQLTTNVSLFDEHVAADTVDPKYVTVTNTTPYRYYAFKFADTYGTNGMGLRRIELQQQYPQRTEITLNDSALTSGKIPVATTNGRLVDSTVTFNGSALGIGTATGYTHANKVVVIDAVTGQNISLFLRGGLLTID